jgi:hypothetical protein
VHLASLDQDVVLPGSSTFSSKADMTTQTITGDLSIPSFTTWLKIFHIPLTVKLSIVPTAPMSGTVTLDSAGQLHVHGHALANIEVNGVGLSILRIPFGCETTAPVDFPIDFDGPISSLGDGQLTFAGTTTFPDMGGCPLSALFTTLMSGPGQTYSFTVAPPAPTRW